MIRYEAWLRERLAKEQNFGRNYWNLTVMS
jgi:hypothetical protein